MATHRAFTPVIRITNFAQTIAKCQSAVGFKLIEVKFRTKCLVQYKKFYTKACKVMSVFLLCHFFSVNKSWYVLYRELKCYYLNHCHNIACDIL